MQSGIEKRDTKAQGQANIKNIGDFPPLSDTNTNTESIDKGGENK
jgi:hypothetical protein